MNHAIFPAIISRLPDGKCEKLHYSNKREVFSVRLLKQQDKLEYI